MSSATFRVGQPVQVDEPDHAVIPVAVEMQGEEFEVGANDENPNFQRVPDQPSDENPPVESQSLQSSEPRLPHPRRLITSQQFERNVRARQSTSSFHPVPSSEAALAFSADSLEPACFSNKQWKKVGVEVRYPVTADMFENPEDDSLAAATSRARARVEVNIKKLSADERAQFRAAQDREMDQWGSNDVISVCRHSQTASHEGIGQGRITCCADLKNTHTTIRIISMHQSRKVFLKTRITVAQLLMNESALSLT